MSESAAPPMLVACLCAAWCDSCRDYRSTFESLAASLAGEAEFAWIDIEDEADALGDLDVENFPTLLIADDEVVRFLGPVTPQAQTAERLLRSAQAGALPAADADAGLLARVRALLRSRGGEPGPA